jgi:predicted double-glycine peptidase
LAVGFQACAGATTARAPVAVTAIRTGGSRVVEPVRSWREFRDRNVVRQRLDYSCGAAALATLMQHYFGDDISEETILVGIFRSMNDEEARDRELNGLSLLDLKLQAERMGYQAAGVRLNFASLARLMGPIVVHLERAGYKHFAVLKGVRGDRIHLADPSVGNVRLSVDRFANEWSGIALVLGKQGFGLPQEFPLALADQELVPNETLAARRALYSR